MADKVYEMTEKVWLYPGETANWHFVNVTKKYGVEIKEIHGKNAKGFGSLPVEVKCGATVWKTSVFPDKRMGTYILPIKALVRKLEDIEAGDKITYSLKVL